MGQTLARTVSLEVGDQLGGVLTEVAEIDSLTTFTEEQDAVEYLEKLGRRLINVSISLLSCNVSQYRIPGEC
jgi:uncharacterized membrane protein YqiK